MLEGATNMVVGLEELYGHDLAEDIDALSKMAYRLVGDNNYVINAMTLEELQRLDKLVRYIKSVVSKVNEFHTIHHNQGAVNLANEFMEHGEKIGNLKKQHGKVGKFLEFRNRTPYYFFKDLGNVGTKVFEAFQDGWDKLAFNAKKVIDFTNETYKAKEVQKWSKETKEFMISQLDGSERTFKMTIAQIIGLVVVFVLAVLGGYFIIRKSKKYDLAKWIGLFLCVAISLTWIFSFGYFNGTQVVDYGMVYQGITDIPNLLYYTLINVKHI
jgi:hypothetical protein